MSYENNYVKIDFESFPSVVISVKDHAPTEAEFEDFLDAMKQTYANEKGRIVLFDLTNAQNVPFSFQIKFANWSKKMESTFEKHLKGVTFYVGNKLIKALLKSIFFLQKPTYEYKVFDKLEDVESHQTALKSHLD